MPLFPSFIVPDSIRHSSFILSDAIRATFTLSHIGVASSSAYLCLFRHKTLPISAYLGIKWHIFVKSDFFSNIGLLVTYPILYLSSRFRKITKFIVLICQNDAIYRINLHNPDFFRTFAAGFFLCKVKDS